MSILLENIRQLSVNEGITITRLEHVIGASKGVLSRAMANNSDIQAKWVVRIVENYPRYNCDWLIKNEGPMIKEEINEQIIISESAINYKELAESRKETIESMKKTIMHLEEKISRNNDGRNNEGRNEGRSKSIHH